jgi:hypothetical protein
MACPISTFTEEPFTFVALEYTHLYQDYLTNFLVWGTVARRVQLRPRTEGLKSYELLAAELLQRCLKDAPSFTVLILGRLET